jgi:hypothetical protein
MHNSNSRTKSSEAPSRIPPTQFPSQTACISSKLRRIRRQCRSVTYRTTSVNRGHCLLCILYRKRLGSLVTVGSHHV